ncbi:ABC transporter substrate-binding protein [Conexibacter woesei]|nr:ABC transporter substrate-binding protein [Conexibacter woesei]
MPIRFGSALVVAGVSLTVAACGATGGEESGGAPSQSVSVAVNSAPASLDPAKAATQSDTVLARALYDTLVRVDVDGEIVPGLATKWTQRPDRAVFTLRRGVTCSDGRALTASMAAASLNRLVAPETAAPTASSSFGGAGMKATADDAAGTLAVTLDRPWSDLVNALGMPATAIICMEGEQAPATLDRQSAGTGPYVLDSVRSGDRYTLARRDGYTWGPKLGAVGSGEQPREVVVRVVANESTVANLLQTRALDAAVLAGSDVDRLEGDDALEVQETDAGSMFVIFNEDPARPFADARLRRAAAQAIDREAFLRAVGGRGRLTPSIVQPGVACFDPAVEQVLPGNDAEAAAQTLGAHGGSLKIIGTTLVGNGQGTTYIQEALRAAGAETTLQNSDLTSWAGKLFDPAKDWDLTVLVVQNISNSISQVASLMVGEAPPRGSNVASLQNPAWKRAVARATSTVGDGRCGAWGDAQRAVVEDVDVLPLTSFTVAAVWSDDVTGLAPQGMIEVGSIRGR